MIIKDREIVKIDTGDVEKLFQWLNNTINSKLIQAGRDLNKGIDWADIAFDISDYVKEATAEIVHQICAKELTDKEIKDILNDLKSSPNNYYYPIDTITPPPPQPKKEITGDTKKDSLIGSLVEFIKDRSEPIGTAGRAWTTLPVKWYTFFKDCDYKYVACPNNNYWWIVADITITKRGKKLYVLMTSRDEKENLWCLAAPTDIEAVE